jgi:hypothetical protein
VLEADREPTGRSAGGESTTSPSSSSSTQLTLAAHRLSRIASARAGSALSSSGDKPVGRSAHGLSLARRLPLALADIGVGYGSLRVRAGAGVGIGIGVGVAGFTTAFDQVDETDGFAVTVGAGGSWAAMSAGTGSEWESIRIARLTPSSPSSVEYAPDNEV